MVVFTVFRSPVFIATSFRSSCCCGAQYVVHVVGPNANPSLPDPISGDYKRGVQEVRPKLLDFAA
jgi:hypothetical protein